MFDLTDPIYSDETAAREHLEGIRWANGVYCPHCGGYDDIRKLGGAAADKGLWHCKPCRKKFTVTVGTVFERSHILLSKWLAAFYLMCSSKKGISAHQGHRLLGVTYKTAWFMWHRIREAMKRGGMKAPPMGGKGKVVEADETYFGNLPEHKAPIRNNPNRPKFGPGHKRAIISLVERGGQVRSFYAEKATVTDVAKIVRENVAKESRLHTDESRVYWKVGEEFAAHEAVNHGQKEFVRGDVTTNTGMSPASAAPAPVTSCDIPRPSMPLPRESCDCNTTRRASVFPGDRLLFESERALEGTAYLGGFARLFEGRGFFFRLDSACGIAGILNAACSALSRRCCASLFG